MTTAEWQACPIDMSDLDLSGDGLRQHWDAMHVGFPETFPQDAAVQEAWRQYHLGQFAKAYETGMAAGGAGVVPALFAATIQAQYVEKDDKRRAALFKQAMKGCEEAEDKGLISANLHYIHAVAMGRYSQSISIIEALAQGFGGRIKEQLQKCLELDDTHAEGHATFGGWHAAISDQAGALMGRMLYGATQDGAHEHYDLAVSNAPQALIPRTEYSRGLEVMYGEKEPDIRKHLEQAMQLPAIDAMQRLDQQMARERLASLPA